MEPKTLRPLLNVEDAPRAIAFYCEHIGFAVDMRFPEDGPAVWANLRCGDFAIMINQPTEHDSTARRARPSYGDAVFYLEVADADASHAELSAKGVPVSDVRQEMYGREFFVRDPDGYEIAFVSSAYVSSS
jgi:uncharacterized glyoxalase superfamily protein PhnB